MKLLTIFYIFLFFPAFSQSSPSDSVDSLVKQIQPTTYQAVFEKINQKMALLDSATAVQKVQAMILVCQSQHSKEILVHAYESASLTYQLFNDVPRAVEMSYQAYVLAKESRLRIDEANTMRVLGQLYREQHKYGLALKMLLEAKELYRQLSYHTSEAKLLYEIGNIYYQTDEYTKAASFLEKAFQVGQDSLPDRLLISAHNTLGLIAESKGEIALAVKEFTISFKLAETKKDTAWIGITSGSLGKMYLLQGQYKRAKAHYRSALVLSLKFNEWDPAVNALVNLGKIFAIQEDYVTAKKHFAQALDIVENEAVFQEQVTLFAGLADFYAQIREFDKAYQYHVRYKEINDSLQVRKNKAEVERIQASFDLNQRRGEIALLRKNNEVIQAEANQKNTIIITISVTWLFILVSAILLYLNNRQKQRSNLQLTQQKRELYEKSQEISRKNEEIMSLNNNLEEIINERTQQLQIALENQLKQNQDLEQFSYTISHNMRSPISQILGMVSIFDQDNMDEPLNKLLLENLKKSATNLNTVVQDLNEILSMRKHADIVPAKIQLSEVAAFVLESLSKEIVESEALITADFIEVDTVFAFRSYVHSILYNLVSNAIKYRSDQHRLQITIKTTLSDEYVCLSVKDNGIGIQLDPSQPQQVFRLYQRMHTHTEGRGLGLYLVKEQIEALGGKVDVESKPHQGSIFRVYFKTDYQAIGNQVRIATTH